MNPAIVVVLAQTETSDGLSIAATGMAIVFVALILVTLFISALPRILALLSVVLPEVPDRHARVDESESLLPDEPMLAAIGYVLHREMQRQTGASDATGK